jgi:hypothetical protein
MCFVPVKCELAEDDTGIVNDGTQFKRERTAQRRPSTSSPNYESRVCAVTRS